MVARSMFALGGETDIRASHRANSIIARPTAQELSQIVRLVIPSVTIPLESYNRFKLIEAPCSRIIRAIVSHRRRLSIKM